MKRFVLQKVSKKYSKKNQQGKKVPVRALDNLDLTLYDNTINAIMGPSGCGKSTLARILMGLEKQDSGEIFYKGRPKDTVPIKEFRQQNQMMFQDPLLSVNPAFKIKKIIAEPLRINTTLTGKEIDGKINKYLDMLELPGDILKRYPHELSGGQLQRAVLARALIPEPEFVILDEPFSALDDSTAQRLMVCFHSVFRQLNMGVLLISHHPERVRQMADHIFSLSVISDKL